MKMLVVIGTRPEAIKLAPVLRELTARNPGGVDCCVTSQHTDLLLPMLEFFEIEPRFDLRVMSPGQTLADVASKILSGIAGLIRDHHYDQVIVQGDTTTAFAAGLAGYYQQIRVAHVEAGLRSGDLRHPFPEEANRRFVDLFAEDLFAPTPQARANLLAEGVDEARIHVTGNTGIDALHLALAKVQEQAKPFPVDLPPHARLLLVTAHRRESFGEPLKRIFQAVVDLVERNESLHVLLPLHPNPCVQESARQVLPSHSRIHRTAPLGYANFVQAMARADVILTDSGGVQEEAPSLGKIVLVIRETTERPEGIEAGAAELVGTERRHIVARVEWFLRAPASKPVHVYGDGRAAQRIASVLLNDVRPKATRAVAA